MSGSSKKDQMRDVIYFLLQDSVRGQQTPVENYPYFHFAKQYFDPEVSYGIFSPTFLCPHSNQVTGGPEAGQCSALCGTPIVLV